MIKGILTNIKRYALHDGPGIRVTLFLKGCPLSCWWCHNPECLGSPGDDMGDQCFTMTPEEAVREIEKDAVFMEETGGGATISGGEPLSQSEFLLETLRLCRERGIHTAVDTSGCAPRRIMEAVVEWTDLFLFDLKLIDDAEHKRYTGRSNRNILDNLGFLAESGPATIIRVPVIPGITDTTKNLSAIASLLKNNDGFEKITLLPYHNMASAKYERLGIENKMKKLRPISKDRTQQVRSFLEKEGFNVSIGG